MDKLEILKNVIGEPLYNKFMEAVGKKEGAAALAGMVAKEASVDETETTETAEVTETAETKTEQAGVDMKALADTLESKLQPILDLVTTVGTSVKGLDEARKADKADLVKRLDTVEATAKEAKKGVEELRGDQTRASNKERASRSDATVTNKEVQGPGADPENEFMTFLFNGRQ